jgi:hypothetical protein
VVTGLVGYLMSLPSVREKYGLDDESQQKLWPGRMKDLVIEFAVEAIVMEELLTEAVSDRLPIAYNGARSCGVLTKKRDNIPGDPLSQTTSTVCIQAPLQHLEEYRLTIVLAPSRCL